jgi:hypothetical protein
VGGGFMAYVPNWERLSRALKLFVDAGFRRRKAKSTICGLIVDRRLKVRLTTAEQVANPAAKAIEGWNQALAEAQGLAPRKRKKRVEPLERTECFTGGNIKVPNHLAPEDFDWRKSRPRKPWLIGPREWKSDERHAFSWAYRPISLIEVSTADVIAWIDSERTAERANDKLQEKSVATAGQESAAIRALASHLKKVREIPRADAEEWCREEGYKLGKRAFARAWPEARDRAGLPRIAPPGRKPKPSR